MESIVFYVLGIISITSALAAVFAKDLVRSIVAFAVFLLSVAGFLALLYIPFLAIGQLVIFVGGLVSLLLFGVMFSRQDKGDGGGVEVKSVKGFSLITPQISAGVFMFLIIFSAASLIFSYGGLVPADFKQFSVVLFRQYWDALLLGVFALFVALVSAVFLLEE